MPRVRVTKTTEQSPPILPAARDWLSYLQASDAAWADFHAFIKTLDIETLRKYDFGKTYEDYLNNQGQRQMLREFCLRCGVGNVLTPDKPQE